MYLINLKDITENALEKGLGPVNSGSKPYSSYNR